MYNQLLRNCRDWKLYQPEMNRGMSKSYSTKWHTFPIRLIQEKISLHYYPRNVCHFPPNTYSYYANSCNLLVAIESFSFWKQSNWTSVQALSNYHDGRAWCIILFMCVQMTPFWRFLDCKTLEQLWQYLKSLSKMGCTTSHSVENSMIAYPFVAIEKTVIPLTGEQIRVVQETWEIIEPNKKEIGVNVYMR